jgi:hypothetical protein
MKQLIAMLSFCVCLAMSLTARCTTLPGACGDSTVQFDVKTAKHQPPPAPPAAGKAQIVFLENGNVALGPFMHATVRFGMDGAWVGADNGSSYFALDVAPGVHHLCANWQSSLGAFNKDVGLTSFTAKQGKVYYFEANVTVESKSVVTFGLSRLNEDEGKYRVSLARLSTSKPRK